METYSLAHHKIYNIFTIQITSQSVSVWYYPHCSVRNDPLMVNIKSRMIAQNLRPCGDEDSWRGSLLSETVLCGWLVGTKLTHSCPDDRGTIFLRNVSYQTVPPKDHCKSPHLFLIIVLQNNATPHMWKTHRTQYSKFFLSRKTEENYFSFLQARLAAEVAILLHDHRRGPSPSVGWGLVQFCHGQVLCHN